MLKRLYPECQELCSYAHGRPIAGFGKGVFDDRSVARKLFVDPFGQRYVKQLFQQQILGASQIHSLISVAQATAELTTLYPLNMELQTAAIKAWNELSGTHFLVNAVWDIWTKPLLRVIG